MAGSDDGGGGNQDANSAASLDDGDFDKYLAELSQSGGGGGGSGSDAGPAEAVQFVWRLRQCRQASTSGCILRCKLLSMLLSAPARV